MDYKEWESLKTGDRVKRLFEGKGTIIASCGVGRVVKFDNGSDITSRIHVSNHSISCSPVNSF